MTRNRISLGISYLKHKPKKKETGPALSGMKKDDLIEECKKLGLDQSGKVAELRERIKKFENTKNRIDSRPI